MSTAADLRARVTEYQTQLAQIIALLLVTPGNDQLVKLKGDLEKAIAVTHQLISQQQHGGGGVGGGASVPVNTTVFTTASTGASAAEGSDGHGSSSGDDDGEEEDGEDGGGIDGGAGQQGSGPSGRGGAVPPTPSEVPLRVGENVEAVGGNRPYAGTVLALSKSNTSTSGEDSSSSASLPDTAMVKYFEFEAPVMVPIAMLQRITRTSIKAGQVVPGLKCQAKFGQDQQWYDAVIESASEHGYMATFIGYGNTEEVPIEYIRPFGFGKNAEERKADMRRANASLSRAGGGVDADGGAATSTTTSGGSTSTGAGATTTASGVRIPASLRILPTDSEEVSSCMIYILYLAYISC